MSVEAAAILRSAIVSDGFPCLTGQAGGSEENASMFS